MSIQRFIESSAAKRAPVHCSRTRAGGRAGCLPGTARRSRERPRRASARSARRLRGRLERLAVIEIPAVLAAPRRTSCRRDVLDRPSVDVAAAHARRVPHRRSRRRRARRCAPHRRTRLRARNARRRRRASARAPRTGSSRQSKAIDPTTVTAMRRREDRREARRRAVRCRVACTRGCTERWARRRAA